MAAPTLKYRSGEDIQKGDRVRFHGNAAEIELVASDASDPDPEVAWHMKEHGGGILVLDPLASGRTFIPSNQINDYEDLEFISRGRGHLDRDQRLTTKD